jgi:hypothetical protein
MLSPQEVVQSMQEEDSQSSDKKGIAGIIRAVVSEAKQFFTDLFSKSTNELKVNKFKVEVENQIELPKVQKIDGEVTLKNAREYVIGLNEIKKTIETTIKSLEKTTKNLNKELKPEKINLKPVVDAIDAIEIPETVIPDYPTEMTISNLSFLQQYFDKLAKQFDIKIPETKIPPYPKEIEVSNFPEPPEDEEEMAGLYWNKNEIGDVTELVEQYPSGNIVSKGWDIARVKVRDERKLN